MRMKLKKHKDVLDIWILPPSRVGAEAEHEVEIDSFVAENITAYSSYGDGQIEALGSEISEISRAIGRFVDVLAEKGVLDPEDVLTIAGEHRNTAEFVREEE